MRVNFFSGGNCSKDCVIIFGAQNVGLFKMQTAQQVVQDDMTWHRTGTVLKSFSKAAKGYSEAHVYYWRLRFACDGNCHEPFRSPLLRPG